MKTNPLGEQALGTAGGTVTGDTRGVWMVEAFMRTGTAGPGTATAAFWVQDEDGNAYNTGKSLVVSGTSATGGTVLGYTGGVPLGTQIEARVTVSGTVNYAVSLIGRS